jgi:hypothetical protein
MIFAPPRVVAFFETQRNAAKAANDLLNAGFRPSELEYSRMPDEWLDDPPTGVLTKLRSLFSNQDSGYISDEIIMMGARPDEARFFERQYRENNKGVLAVIADQRMYKAKAILRNYTALVDVWGADPVRFSSPGIKWDI